MRYVGHHFNFHFQLIDVVGFGGLVPTQVEKKSLLVAYSLELSDISRLQFYSGDIFADKANTHHTDL